jgi:hypothetical protein
LTATDFDRCSSQTVAVIELRTAIDFDVDAVARIHFDSWNRRFGDLAGSDRRPGRT